MTYNQIIKQIRELLQSHALIKSVKTDPPKEWLFKDSQPAFPVACFWVDNGSFATGRQVSTSVNFIFLDKSGIENEFADEVISDQIGIAHDVFEKLALENSELLIDTPVQYNIINDKHEDYLSGVQMTINITTQSEFNACNFPTV